MSLSNDEKGLIEEALGVYLQFAARQVSPQQAQQLAVMAQGIVSKLDNLSGGGGNNAKPAGISDEWFDNVCKTCDKLGIGGCEDKVTLKFPGKCDPILHYERKKTLNQSR